MDRRLALERMTGEWRLKTIAQALDRAADCHAEDPLVMTDDRVWSYREIREASRVVAARLIAEGVRPQDHVAILLANHVEFVIAKFAIARIGAVAVPINFMLRQAELGYILRQADCVALVSVDQFRGHDHLSDLDLLMPDWETRGGGDAFPLLRSVLVCPIGGSARPGMKRLIEPGWMASPEDLAAVAAAEAAADPLSRCDVLYTSGTTGHPKGVMITHDMVRRTAYASTYVMAREERRRVLFALPMHHVFGYIECLIASLFVGGAIVPRTQFDALDMVEAAERFAVGEITCVPMMTLAMLDVVRKRGFNCPSLVAFFNSGGVSPPTIWQDIRDQFGATELLTGYGMTETSGSTFCALPEGDIGRLQTNIGKLKDAGLAGIPEDGGRLTNYKVVNPVTGVVLAPGEKGELLARGYCVTSGYYKKPDESARAFTEDGWLRTGDIGSLDAEGYVQLAGRVKEAYRCGGEMVMPEEVEKLLRTHPEVRNAIVVGVPDPRMGEVGCAFVVTEGLALDADAVKAFCLERIARFKIPKYVIAVTQDELPYTATGRPRRVQLAGVAIERLGL